MATFVTLGLALALLGQEYEIPNDRLGIGAAGTIGRGTGPGEHMVPIFTAPPSVPTYFLTPAPTPIPRARTERNRPGTIEPVASPAAEVRLVLPALARENPYRVFHRGWVHGSWNVAVRRNIAGHAAGLGGRGFTLGAGLAYGGAPDRNGRLAPGLGYQPAMGLGSGIPAWLIGPMAYAWGYYGYDNPFVGAVPRDAAGQPRSHDYSRPIDVLAPPPTEALLDDALEIFASARTAFRREDYPRALERSDAALRLMPDDPALQQFRALTLFALRRYDEAAATLYAVLAVVPGWDWTTMIELYADRETYTRALRDLESYAGENPRSTAARFLLAYHYLSTGYPQQAADQWERVLEGRPTDPLSSRLSGWLRALQPAGEGSLEPVQAAPSLAGPSGTLQGTWTARPAADTVITLDFQDHGHVTWQVRQPGRDRRLEGYSRYETGILTLTQDQDESMMGSVSWDDRDHFTFRILGGGPDDPGLKFTRRS